MGGETIDARKEIAGWNKVGCQTGPSSPRGTAGAGAWLPVKEIAVPASAKTITYLADKTWDSKALLHGKNGIAALTFCEVPLEFARTNP